MRDFRFAGSRLSWTPFGAFDWLELSPEAGPIGGLVIAPDGQLVDILCDRGERYRLVVAGEPARWTLTRLTNLPAPVENMDAVRQRMKAAAEKLRVDDEWAQREAALAAERNGKRQSSIFRSEKEFMARIRPAIKALATAPVDVTLSSFLQAARINPDDLSPRDYRSLEGVFKDVVRPCVEATRLEFEDVRQQRRPEKPPVGITIEMLRNFEKQVEAERRYSNTNRLQGNDLAIFQQNALLAGRRGGLREAFEWWTDPPKAKSPTPAKKSEPVTIGGPRAYFED